MRFSLLQCSLLCFLLFILIMKSTGRFICDERSSGRRLDEFLAERLGALSRMALADLLEEGACSVNGNEAPAGYHLSTGDVVEIAFDPSAQTAMTPEPLALEILYEDDCLLVLNKPAGMLVHPTRAEKSGTLANALAYHLNKARNQQAETSHIRPGLVHRLDRATSGLMVVAKTQRALSTLTRHFHRRLVEKKYLAVVRGRVCEDEMEIEAPIGRDAEAWPRWRVMETGKKARTRLSVLERRADKTLVELEPVTGRTNQLRIHCAHVGHAIAGDSWYGVDDDAERLCLHAAQLAFHHPATGEWLEFTEPMPEGMKKILMS